MYLHISIGNQSTHELPVASSSDSGDPALSESDDQEILVDAPAGIWADHMELDEGLAELETKTSECASQQQLGLAADNDDNDMLDIGLDMHGLLED